MVGMLFDTFHKQMAVILLVLTQRFTEDGTGFPTVLIYDSNTCNTHWRRISCSSRIYAFFIPKVIRENGENRREKIWGSTFLNVGSVGIVGNTQLSIKEKRTTGGWISQFLLYRPFALAHLLHILSLRSLRLLRGDLKKYDLTEHEVLIVNQVMMLTMSRISFYRKWSPMSILKTKLHER